MSWSPFATAAAVQNGQSNYLAVSEMKNLAPSKAPECVPDRVFKNIGVKPRKGAPKQGASGAVVPMIETSVMTRHKYRFVSTAGVGAASITVGTIFGAIGTVGTVANSTVTTICSSFRIRKVDIYESAQSVATVSSELLWASPVSVNSSDVAWSNATIPYDRPSRISAAPPKGTLASFWWNSSATSTTPLFSLTCAIGSIVDVEIEATLSNALTGVTISVSTAVLGALYFLYLDGNTSHKLAPVGLPATF